LIILEEHPIISDAFFMSRHKKKGHASMTEAHQLCVCGELSCKGCSCGTDCPFSPGHTSGTIATEPILALIEAAKRLLNGLASNEYYDDRELEPTSGQVYPDVRRLNATIAYVEKILNNSTPQTTREKPVERERGCEQS
jgi:hypothetical protein